MSYFQGNSIFWIEVEKIKPNPYQPRKEFDEAKLNSLAESVRQYGVLQPLVVTRREVEKPDGGISVEYELIAGERRLRASKIARLTQVPVIIKSGEEDALLKLELAIIENIQREDLNPIDRALAFSRLVEEFGFKHGEVGKKVGKSREYVSNTLRLLTLPEEIKNAVALQKVSEGHARTLMMLNDRPEEQMTLFKEVVYKNLTVRETEAIARRIAHDKIRKKETAPDPEIVELEDRLSESLGTRVQIERREKGGKIMIDFFSSEDIRNIIALLSTKDRDQVERYDMLSRFIQSQQSAEATQTRETDTNSELARNISPEVPGEQDESEGHAYAVEVAQGGLDNDNIHLPEESEIPVSHSMPIERPSFSNSEFPAQEERFALNEEPSNVVGQDTEEDDDADDLYSVSNFTI